MENEKTYVDEAYLAEDGYTIVPMDDERGGLVIAREDKVWDRMDEGEKRAAIDELIEMGNLYRSYTLRAAIEHFLAEVCDVDPDDFEIGS